MPRHRNELGERCRFEDAIAWTVSAEGQEGEQFICMNENVKIIFGLFGGLAIFLYGMNMMSESLQKAAGEKMRKVLAVLTKNRLLGVLSGALVTAVLQSSSATTVMAIGFVSAGLMTLPQAISIIFGANIGTTMTAQIIAFKLSDYIYIIILAGFLLSFLARKQKVKYIGQTIFAFGLLFDGIEIMGSVMKPLAQSQMFLDMIGRVSDVPILGVLTGCLMTLVVQSSSATIAVLQNFASQAAADGVSSIIGLAGAIPVLLGDNIGTTITAVLASIGQSRDAKRTALAHCIFNISGSILFLFLLKPYTAFIRYISTKGPEVEVISRQIANAHTGFNVIMTLIWTPLLMVMVHIVTRMIPDHTTVSESLAEPRYLDNKLIGQPVSALHLASREVLHCGHVVQDILDKIVKITALHDKDDIEKLRNGALQECGAVVSLDHHIDDYMAAMFADGSLDEKLASKAAGIMLMQNEIQRVGVLCRSIIINIAGDGDERKARPYSEEARRDINSSLILVKRMVDRIIGGVIEDRPVETGQMVKDRDRLMVLEDKMRSAHMKRVSRGGCSASLTEAFTELLHNLDRVAACCVNLEETATSEVNFHELLSGEPLPGEKALVSGAAPNNKNKAGLVGA